MDDALSKFEAGIERKLFAVLEDDYLHLPYCALQGHQYGELDEKLTGSDLFERLEKLLKRFPEKPTKLKPLVWPWTNYSVDRKRSLPRTEGGEVHVFVQHFKITKARRAHLIQLKRK